MDLGAALVALLIALVVKLGVIALATRLLLRLYRVAYRGNGRPWLLLPKQDLPEIRVLWWSLVLFGVSELTCGVEVYVLFRSSPLMSGLHSVTSGLGMALFALGLYLLLDRKLIRFGGPACLVNRICRGCTMEREGCRFRSLMLLGGTLVALAGVAPLFAPTSRMDADTARYLLPFPALNAWYDGRVVPWLLANVPGYQPSGVAYYLPQSMLQIEFRIVPAAAIALALLGIACARGGRERLGIRLMVFAVGLLCYTYFELALYRVTGDVLLGSLGHEVAELWFLIATAELLRQIFPGPPQPAPSPSAAS